MGWVEEFRSHHKLPSHHHHCDLYNPSIASWWYVCIYHPIDFPIPLPGVASHPIHNPPLELSTIPPHTHIQPPRYHRTAIIFLEISRKAGPLPPVAFALSAYYSYILHICSCCEAVCLNGGQQLRESVTALVEGKLSSFTGSVASGGSACADASSSGGPGASASGSGGSGTGANSSGRDNGAGSPEAAGTGAASRAGGAGSPAPTAPISRMGRRKAQRDKKVARPPGDVDAPESRADVAEREFNAYMKEAAPSNSSDFDLLQYWATRSVDGIDPSGKVVVSARWPHIGLLARLYAGVDTTSCQAERIFSALKHVVSDMRAGTLPHKVEKMLLLRLNRHLIPGFAEVVKQLEALKAKCDVHAAVSVAAQNAREGDFVHVA